MRVPFFLVFLLVVSYRADGTFNTDENDYKAYIILLPIALMKFTNGDTLEIQVQQNETTSFDENRPGDMKTIVPQQPLNIGMGSTGERKITIDKILERMIPTWSERSKSARQNEFVKPLGHSDDIHNDADYIRSIFRVDDKTKKSPSYNAVLSTLPSFTSDYHLKSRVCKNRCGISASCSCKPICQIFKTCCIDFIESCGGFYNLTLFQEEYEWLYSVHTECIDRNVVVSSCGNQNQNGRDYNYQENYANSTHALSFRENAVQSDIYAKENGTIMDLLLHLRSMFNGLGGPLSDEESMLLSTPILDLSTGITYRNVSMYTCNQADVGQAIVNPVFVPINESEFRSKTNANTTAQDIDVFQILNFSKSCSCTRFSKFDIVRENTEKCFAENMIQSCPKDFIDDDVIDACQDVSFLVSRITKDENSNRIYEMYKNPFCLFCHMMFSNSDEKSKLSILDPVTCLCQRGGHDGLVINFNHLHKVSHDVFVERRFKTAYAGIVCSFVSPNNKLKAREANATSPTDLVEYDHGQVLKSECRAEDCKKHFRESNRCLALWVIFLYLPPTKVTLSDEYLGGILQTWREILRDRFPGYWREVNASTVYFRRFAKTRVKYDYEYDYSIHVGIYSEMLGANTWGISLVPAIRNMFSKEPFIFKKGQNYICLDHARSINSNKKTQCVTLRISIPVDDTTAFISGFTRPSPSQLTTEIVLFLCFFLPFVITTRLFVFIFY